MPRRHGVHGEIKNIDKKNLCGLCASVANIIGGKMIKRYLLFITIGIIFTVMFSSCNQKSPAPWPWWTSADSVAVNNELKLWRDTFNGYHFISGQNNATLTYPLEVFVPLVSSDTTSRNGDSIVKIAHFLGAFHVLGDSTHLDELIFEVKNDTIETRDTFCFVTYNDSTRNCIGVLRYDSLWIIKFQIASVDTTVTPWDTSWRVSSITKTADSIYTVHEEQNIYPFTIMRKLELKKDSAATFYRMKNFTGFGKYIPNTTVAPTIGSVILSKSTRTDTFYYGARLDRKGIYNPKSKDSLFTIPVGESLTVKINTTTPTDTLTDRNYFFVSCGTPYVTTKHNITIAPNNGSGKVAFTHSGLMHLYIEVIPASTLFYPYSQWKSTTWAIPIKVTPL